MASTETDVVLESIVIVRNEDHDISAPGTTSSFERTQAACEQQTQQWLRRNQSRIFGMVSKVAAIASLLLTALMAWPAITSSADTRMATLLAEWTSQKEYLEFCEAHNWESNGLGEPDIQGSAHMGPLALSTVVCCAGLLWFLFAFRRKFQKRYAMTNFRHIRRSIPRSGGEIIEHMWLVDSYRQIFPPGESSTSTTGTDLITQERRANLRHRSLGGKGTKRKLRKTPRMYGSDSPDTSDDDLFMTKKRNKKLPTDRLACPYPKKVYKNCVVGNFKHD
ncbi:hypothetical protein CONLIGDRAFT_680316 [Coniochaeta ligniaria NRRL 30616]|uniref:Transmembrane protein n=1 Tax=Coniochaeta ligniaria NRRL 30616 TaxID=1408157 RepID=A0A1J7IQI9_9PEZI|nr:hypothetical protein CONLIGDRAFT_680316 [Coniochaeta ligniaria NRRL 30616]